MASLIFFTFILFVYYLQLKELTPQVSHVAKILLDYGKHSPGDVPAVSVHFESMRDGWKDKMQALTNLVDSATDTGKFIEACGMYHVIIQFLSYCGCLPLTYMVQVLSEWYAKFRTGKFLPGTTFTICTNQFH